MWLDCFVEGLEVDSEPIIVLNEKFFVRRHLAMRCPNSDFY